MATSPDPLPRTERRRRAEDDRTREPWLTTGRLTSLVAVLAVAYGTLSLLRALRPLLLMLLVALFLSFAMEPAVQFLSRRGWRRGAATAAVFGLVALLNIGFVAAMAPLLVAQVRELVVSAPRILTRLGEALGRAPLAVAPDSATELRGEVDRVTQQLGTQLDTIAFGAAGQVVDVGATAVEAVFQLFTILLVTFYLVADGPRARQVLFQPFPPERQRELLAMWELAVAKTGGYIYSRLLLAVLAAGAAGVFFVAVGLEAAVPLAMWVGITSAFVPVVGTYIGGLLPIVVAATSPEPSLAVWILVFLVVYQQVENYLLAPRIHSRTMEVHPAVAFVSVLTGGYLLGAIGALLALPAAAIIQALLSTYVSRHDLIEELKAYDPQLQTLPPVREHRSFRLTRPVRARPQPPPTPPTTGEAK